MLVMTNLSYMAEEFYVDRDISVGNIVALVVSDGVLNVDEGIREFLRRISDIRESEDVLVGIYRLEKVLEDGEWFRTSDAIVRKYGGIVIFTGIEGTLEAEEDMKEYGKELTIKEVFSRLRDDNDIAIDVSEEILADFGLVSGKKFRKYLRNALYVLVGFVFVLILLYGLGEMRERVSLSALEDMQGQLEDKKNEFKRYKNRFYKFVEGVKVEDIKKADKLSYVPFIPKTVKVEIQKGKVNVAGNIYSDDVPYTKSLCNDMKISCSLKFKSLTKGVDVYEVVANPR